MRAILIAIFIFIQLSFALAQTNVYKDYAPTYIEPAALVVNVSKWPFSHIKLVDVRSDSSKLGYVKRGLSFNSLQTKESFINTIAVSLEKNNLQTAALPEAPALHIYVKHLWLQPATANELKNLKLSHGYKTSDTMFVSYTSVLECYLEKDNMLSPLYKFDTTFIRKGLVSREAEDMTMLPFQLVLEKLQNTDINRTRKQFHHAEIKNRYTLAANHPVLHTAAPLKGVYASFRDFLKNEPAYTTFSVDKDKKTDHMYVQIDKDLKLIEDYWGYSDGEKVFIKIGFNLFELFRKGDTYEFYGFKYLRQTARLTETQPSSIAPIDLMFSGVLGHSTKMNKIDLGMQKPMQLNMDTGQPY